MFPVTPNVAVASATNTVTPLDRFIAGSFFMTEISPADTRFDGSPSCSGTYRE
jgi:hypothetical protein